MGVPAEPPPQVTEDSGNVCRRGRTSGGGRAIPGWVMRDTVSRVDHRPIPKYDGRRLWSALSSCDSDGHERTRMGNKFSRLVDMLPGLVWTALADGHIDF